MNKREILAWSFYDWANSAYATVILTFIIAPYFTQSVAPNVIAGTEAWGYAMAIAGLCVAILSPPLSIYAELRGLQTNMLIGFSTLAILSCSMLWWVKPQPTYQMWALTWLVVGTIGYETAIVFYNGLLRHLAPKHYLGRVSGWAWGLGYLGGLTCLGLSLTLFIQTQSSWPILDRTQAQHIRILGPFVALWFTVFALPLWWVLYRRKTPLPQLRITFKEMWQSLRTNLSEHHILLFLLARMLYTDGLNTLFMFGGIIAAGTFGLNTQQILLFGIGMNLTAGLGAFTFGWLDDHIGARKTILLSLTGLIGFTGWIFFISDTRLFVILAMCLGIFVGPVQAASRSYLARLAPAEKQHEWFGLYAMSGRITAFLGPWLFAVFTAKFASQRAGVLAIICLWLLGGLILWRHGIASDRLKQQAR